MLELKLVRGRPLKKVLEAIKDLVTDANFDCSATGLYLQATDFTHIALVALLLRSDGFDHFRCDRDISLGMNLANMAKIFNCASQDDVVTIKADDGSGSVTFLFESSTQDKIADYEMTLMNIESNDLDIPDAEYKATVRMPSSELARICRVLNTIGDTVLISVTNEAVKFSTRGDIGIANIVCKQNTAVNEQDDATMIEFDEPVSMSFALWYMNAFTKATPVARQVTISLSPELPIRVEYKIERMGYIRFYLAPTFEEDDIRAQTEEAESSLETNPEVARNKPNSEIKPKQEMIELDEKVVINEEVEQVETKRKLEMIENEDESQPNMETKRKTEAKAELDAMVVEKICK